MFPVRPHEINSRKVIATSAAQKCNEKYRDMVVRITGYCAYFVDLTPSQQAGKHCVGLRKVSS